ncbi:hypothetical protein SVAN01_06340 [Stagonosporopsis vannaccii]|nr:hypothetical protein SVAN01_06340 [Stagonosporopsis vannaccii]
MCVGIARRGPFVVPVAGVDVAQLLSLVIIVIEAVGWVRNGATQLGVVEECGGRRRKTRGGASNATNGDGVVTVAAHWDQCAEHSWDGGVARKAGNWRGLRHRLSLVGEAGLIAGGDKEGQLVGDALLRRALRKGLWASRWPCCKGRACSAVGAGRGRPWGPLNGRLWWCAQASREGAAGDNRTHTTTATTTGNGVGGCLHEGEAMEVGELSHVHRATALLLLVASGAVDPRPAPSCQLGGKLQKLQGYGRPGPDMGALRTPHAVRARQGWAARERRRPCGGATYPRRRPLGGRPLRHDSPVPARALEGGQRVRPASVPLRLRRPPSNVEQFANLDAQASLRALAVEPRRRGQPLQGLLPGRGHDMSDSIAVTRAACHSMRSQHGRPRSKHTPAQAGFLREAAFWAPPMPTPRSLFAASIRQESTRSLEPSIPVQACPERHSIPGCHGGRLLSIPGSASCTAKQNAHWLSHEMFRAWPSRLDCCRPFNIA